MNNSSNAEDNAVNISAELLTHLCLMDPTIINWTNLFRSKGLLGSMTQFHSNFESSFCKQTVEALVRLRILRRLIWVCTVCLCPTKRTLRLYGLIYNLGFILGNFFLLNMVIKIFGYRALRWVGRVR